MLLTPPNAKLLEKNVLERLEKKFPDRTLMKTISQHIVPAIIITLQEYERMAEGGESESSHPTENQE